MSRTSTRRSGSSGSEEPTQELVEDAWLTPGEVRRRTGVQPGTLRSWESRYGFPEPQRLPSGHRRYAASDVALIRHVLRRQQQGMRLQSAFAEATRSAVRGAPGSPSVFAALTREPGQVAARPLHKSTLVSLSHAIEDEFCARASSPVLFGAFQTEHRYRPSAPRWQELARTARSAIVFADFTSAENGPVGGPTRVRLPADAPMRREWVVVCDAPDLAVCLSAWELPGQDDLTDRRRLFETVWTVDPRLVRRAARVCAGMAVAAAAPGARRILADLERTPVAGPPDLSSWSRLFDRFVAYLDGACADPGAS